MLSSIVCAGAAASPNGASGVRVERFDAAAHWPGPTKLTALLVAMKVVVCQNDIVPARGEAVDVGSPLAGDLRLRYSTTASEFIGNTTSAAQLGKH